MCAGDTSIEANTKCPWKLSAFDREKTQGKFKIMEARDNT